MTAPEQMSLTLARAQGEEGMQRAADHAEREAPGWRSLAMTLAAMWLRSRDGAADCFTAEDLVDGCIAADEVVRPRDERAFGAIVKRALHADLMEYADSRGRRRKGHGSRCDRYRSLIVGHPWTSVVARISE